MAQSLSFLLFGEDVTASKAFAKVASSAEASDAKIKGAFSKGSTVAIGALAVGLGAAVKAAGNFQQSTNVLVTAAGELPKNLGLIRDGILKISATTGTSWQQVTDGMYLLEKAGYRGADALKVETAAAQGAREEGARLGTVTQAMTSIMASYGLKASDSVTVMNELKTAAGESKTTMENFAGSLSTVLPIASANKIAFSDIAGNLATLTQHGTSADEATQELAFSIRGLSAPNAVAIKEMAQLGISSVDVATKLGDGPGGRGLAGTLDYLSQTVLQKMGPAGTLLLATFNQSKVAAQDATTELNAMGPAAKDLATQYQNNTISAGDYIKAIKDLPGSQNVLARQFKTTEDNARGYQTTLRNGLADNQTYSDAMKKMTGGMNGLNVALQTTGTNTEGTQTRIAAVAAAAKNAGDNVNGWASTQGLFNVKLDIFKQTVETTGIMLGTEMLPALTDVMSFITGHQQVVIDLVTGLVGIKVAMIAIKVAQEAWAASSALLGVATTVLGVASQIKDLESAYIAAMYAMDIASGPVGWAIAAIGVGIGIATKGFGLFGGAAHDQIKPVQGLTDAITADGDAMGLLTMKQIANTLQQKGMLDAGVALGINQATLTDAVMGNAGAMQTVIDAVNKATNTYVGATTVTKTFDTTTRLWTTSTGKATQAQKDANAAAQLLANGLPNLQGQLNASKHAADNVAAAIKSIPSSKSVTITASTASAMGAVANVQTKLDKVHNSGLNNQLNIDNTQAMNALAALQQRLANLQVNAANGIHVSVQQQNAVAGVGVGHNAQGTNYWPGGLSWVGENGPEVVNLPRGASVTPNHKLGGGTNVQVTIYAGIGTDGAAVGRQVASALEKHVGGGGTLTISRGVR